MQTKNIPNISFQRLDVDLNAQSDYSKLGRLNFCWNMQRRNKRIKNITHISCNILHNWPGVMFIILNLIYKRYLKKYFLIILVVIVIEYKSCFGDVLYDIRGSNVNDKYLDLQ